MELWRGVLHTVLVGYVEAWGAYRELRESKGGEEEYESISQNYHSAVLLGKLRQTIRQATDREGGGCLLPDDQCTKTGRLFVEVLQEKHTDM